MIPKQKFMVGEAVAVYGVVSSEFDTERTEVIDAIYAHGNEMINCGYGPASTDGWRYKTAHQPDKSKWWVEDSLVKLKSEGKSFAQMMKDLNRETV